MRELYIYNKALELTGITDEVSSIMLTKRFYDGSTFQAEFPLTEKNRELIQPQAVIEFPNRFSGIITDVNINTSVISVNGKSFDGMLESRVITTGSVDDTMLTVIDKNACEAADENRRFERTYVDKNVDAENVSKESLKYQNLADYARTICYERNLGVFSEIVHGDTNKIRLFIRNSVDRTVNQSERDPVVFSDLYENVNSMEYNYSENGAVNSAFIYSKGMMNDHGYQTCSPWSGSFGTATGYARRESVYEIEPCIYYKTVYYGEIAVWSPMLNEEKTILRAEAEFAEQRIEFTDCVSAAVIVDENYAEQFDVGDVVTVYSQKMGVFTDYQVTEINESYSEEGVLINATFGEPIKSLRRLIK